MIELIDNTVQAIVTMLACFGAGVLFQKSHRQSYFFLSCFYGLFSLGTIYWTLHLALLSQTPPMFYVSDAAWIASFVFLLILVLAMTTDEEKKTRHPLLWLAPTACIALTLFYCTYGDILINLLLGGLTATLSWVTARGLLCARRQGGRLCGRGIFHLAVFAMMVVEHCLWISSCFWVNDTLANPYFWFDFLLTANLFALLPATRKAVEA